MAEKNKPSTSLVNFRRALENLRLSISTPVKEARDLSGILKDFEMAYELSWKSLKKYLKQEGHETLGAKDVFSKAFQLGYLPSESPWLEMIDDRNQTAHVYDEGAAKEIAARIKKSYLTAFDSLITRLQG